jgi:hypothetical protein
MTPGLSNAKRKKKWLDFILWIKGHSKSKRFGTAIVTRTYIKQKHSEMYSLPNKGVQISSKSTKNTHVRPPSSSLLSGMVSCLRFQLARSLSGCSWSPFPFCDGVVGDK